MAAMTFLGLGGANPTGTVLENLKSSSLAVKTALSHTLNYALRSELSATLTSAELPALAALVDKMKAVDIVAANNLSIQALVKQQLDRMVAKDPVMQQAVDGEIAELSDTTTIGILLKLGVPLQQHPLFKADVMKADIASMLATSPSLGTNQQLHADFISRYAESTCSIQEFWRQLIDDSEFKEVVPELQFTLQLGLLASNNVPMVAALQKHRKQGTVKSLRDLVKFDADAWSQIINTPVEGQAIKVPSAVAGVAPQENTANYVNGIIGTLEAAFPTAVVAKKIAASRPVNVNLVETLLALNPGVRPGDPVPAKLNVGDLSANEQTQARAEIEALHHEMNVFARLEYQMLVANGGANPIRDGVSKFFDNSPDFDLQSTRINTYLHQQPNALKDIPEQHKLAVTDQLKRIQRVFRITPRYDEMSALLGERLDSASSIASVPQSVFVGKFSDHFGGPERAMAVHATARHVHASALNLFRQVHAALSDVTPRAIGPVAASVGAALQTNPDWENLFGSLSLCDCQECQSVYGAAAYFVDLLQFLKNSGKNGTNQTPLDVLLARRPDLPFIKLNCQNTNTVLPYVDLVNEILEAYVASADPKAAKNTGDASADDLSVNPEYVNDQAYLTLTKAVYPFDLPFDRPLEMSRAYLGLMGSSRYELMKSFQLGGDPPDFTKGTPSGLALACEYLGISHEEHTMLTGTDLTGKSAPLPKTLPEFYGYQAANPSWVASLQTVEEFLRRTGLSYLDLVEVVKTRFVNPAQAITLDVPADADPCDLSRTTLKNLDVGALQQIHPFLRLWRKLSWSMEDLDETIRALGKTLIDDVLLVKLAVVKRLEKDLNLSLDQLRSFWSAIDVEGRDSLYLRLFQNKAVLNPLDIAFALLYSSPLAALPAGVTAASLAGVTNSISYSGGVLQFVGLMTEDEKTALHLLSSDKGYQLAIDDLFQARNSTGLAIAANDPSPKISLHAPAMLAALRISSSDLAALSVGEKLGDILDLPTLSQFYRFTALAKSLRLSVADLSSLERLTGASLAQPGDPATSIDFIWRVQKVRQSGFSVAQLNYLYRDVSDPNQDIAPQDANVSLFLTNLQTALKKVTDGTSVAPVPAASAANELQQQLAVVLDASTASKAMGLLDGSVVYSIALVALPVGIKLPSNVNYDPAAKKLSCKSAMTSAERIVLLALSSDSSYQDAVNNLFQQPRDFIKSNLTTFLDFADAVNQLIENTSLIITDKDKYVLVRLLARTSVVKQTLSGNLGLDVGLTELLLETVLNSQSGSEKAMRDLLAVAPPYAGTPAWATYHLIYKVALLVKGFRMTLKDVTYLAANGTDFANFDFNTLPLGGVEPSPAQVAALFAQWDRLYDLFTLRDSVAQGEALFDLFGTAAHPPSPQPSPADLAAQLATATGWDKNEVSLLTGSAGFNLAVGDYKNEVKLLPLLTCWNLIQRLGVSAERLFHWAGDPLDPTLVNDLKNSNEIKSAARARFDDQTWLSVAKPFSDRLRESQRAALMAYVQAALTFSETGQLFDHFLIDVEMSPCMMTSRIVQAVSSVQLFVQRCLMNLESKLDSNRTEIGVGSSAIDSDEWRKWRKYYRVWEANRKVFLYPENWIEPELRDDKSPFFKDLENELLQNEVNAQTVEQAFLNYLEKLDDVSRLDIVGSYHDDEADVLHVFGRTFHTPRIYYYRQLTSDGTWTAWEKVPLDIQGDDLIPVVYERRLYLFWPIFTAKSPEQSQDGSGGSVPLKHWEIQLAWGQYRNGKWSAKQMSEGILRWPNDDVSYDKLPGIEFFVFKSLIVNQGLTDQNLAIRAYVEQLVATTATGTVMRAATALRRAFAGNSGTGIPPIKEKGADLTVSVSDSHGDPIDKVMVTLIGEKLPRYGRTSSGLNQRGSIIFQVAVTTYQVTVTVPSGYMNTGLNSQTVEITSTADIATADFTFQSLLDTGIQYASFGEFLLECAGAVVPVSPLPLPDQKPLQLASGCHPEGMMLAENLGGSPPLPVGYLNLLTQDQNKEGVKVLGQTPSAFHLLPPHQLDPFLLQPPSSSARTLTLIPAASPVVAGSSATFTPAATLAPDTYTATITTGAQDQAGNALLSNFVWSFTIGGISGATKPGLISTIPASVVAPQVISTVPLNGATGVTINQGITATFSEAMNPATLNATTFTVIGSGGVAVTGTVTYQNFSLNPTSLTFASQQVGTSSSPQTITLTTGAGIPNATASISGANARDFKQSNTCQKPMGPGGGCTITVTFSPSAGGSRIAVLTVIDATGASQTGALSGTGIGVPGIGLAPDKVDFGNQLVGTTGGKETVTVTSTGTAPLFLTGIIPSGDFAATNNCPMNPAPANCQSVYPSGYVPFSIVFYTSAPDAAGNRVVLGSMTAASFLALNMVPVAGPVNQVFCTIVQLAPGVFVQAYVPTAAERMGDFSSFSVQLTDPTTGKPFPGNKINPIPGLFGWRITSLTPVGLSIGESCNLQASFTPTSVGARTGVLAITDNAPGSPHAVSLSGTGAVPSATLSPTTLNFGGQTVGTPSVPQSATLTNTGSVPLNIGGIGISGLNANDFTIADNNCGNTLPAKGSCSISLKFNPSAGGSRSAVLTVPDNVTGGSQTVALSGVGVVPGVALYPTSLAFGDQRVNTAGAAQTVTLTNTGNTPVTMTITTSGNFAQTNNYSGVVVPSASCSINVTFTPSASGSRTGVLTIADSSAGSPHTVSLTGNGTQPLVSLSPTSLAFTSPAVGSTSAPQTVTLNNSGTAPLSIIGISIAGANSDEFFYTRSGANMLAPGENCSIGITFTPSHGGSSSAQLVITDDAGDSPQSVNLTGNITGPVVSLSPSSLTFTRQAVGTTSVAQTVTLANTGGAALNISSVSISGDFALQGSTPTSVASGASSTINVTFTPTGGGVRTGTLTFVDNAAGSPHTVSLTGTGLSSETYEFFYQDDRRTYYVSLAQPPAKLAVRALTAADAVAPAYASHQLASPPAAILSLLGNSPIVGRAAAADVAVTLAADPAPAAHGADPSGNTAIAVATVTPQVEFFTHFHPHICAFIKALNRDGIPGLLTIPNQQLTNDGVPPNTPTVFEYQYSPQAPYVATTYPAEDVDFKYIGAYGLYNWELFFHAPLLVATRLSANQQFEEAQKWFHYIFDPTKGDNYWRVLPFQTIEKDRIQDLLELLDYKGNQSIVNQRNAFESQLTQWRADPFNPHLIARLRPIAYQKTVVMKYLDNLIAWGDQLFRQDTMETINQATQLYVMAQELLGPRPERVPSRESAQDQTYSDIQAKLDDFSNLLVQLENDFPFSVGPASNPGGGLGLTGAFYFCVPNNDQLLGYWDTVADRLFKVRHCRTIEGVVRQPSLFAPPISPGLLVRAAALGVDLTSALSDIEAATPYYRFSYVLQKALELCAEVRSLGAALLSALEKNDGEALALLRATQETGLLKAVRNVKEKQIDEAQDTLEGLQASYAVTKSRQQYYQQLITSGFSPFENTQIGQLKEAQDFQGASQVIDLIGSYEALIPQFNLGASGFVSSPVVTAMFGGANLSKELELAASVLRSIASVHTFHANMASIMGGWDRRSQEWNFQLQTATEDLTQIQRQIDAATVRVQIAKDDLQNQQLQITNAQAVLDFFNAKYTNQELYGWMISQTSSVFFQCYQMAYDMAKRAEKAFRFERGLTDSGFIGFGYWDNRKKGLLSGEQLYLDLKRLEMAYLDQNKRDYEISKHISLVLTAPMALIFLKETGKCAVDLPEALFDADYPGHFMRRIKSISLTIPCVTGPYTSVNCTLTLLKNSIRFKSDSTGTEGNYTRDKNQDPQKQDPRFVDNFAATQSIATSTAQNDSGMFEVNFRDERYLPFEGAGAISTWQIDLPKDTNAFDFETISDVVINLNYMARDGGDELRQAARSAVISQPVQNALRLFSLRHEFPSEWSKFWNSPDTAVSQSMQPALTVDRFPFQFRGRTIRISQVDLFLRFKDTYPPADSLDPATRTPQGDYDAATTPLTVYIKGPSGNSYKLVLNADKSLNGVPHGTVLVTEAVSTPEAWTVQANDTDPKGAFQDDIGKLATGASSLCYSVTDAGGVKHNRLRSDIVQDIMMLCLYSVI